MLAPSFYRCLVAIVSACLAFSFLSPALGQTTTSNFRDALNSKPFPPATDQELINPYWTTDTGWKAELQLRHNQQGRSLTVAPALRRPDGRETSLTSINVKTQEAKSIYLDSAIGISVPQLVGTGSVVVRYHPASPTNIYAVSMVGAVGLSTAFHLGCQGRISPCDWQPRRHLEPNDSGNDYLLVNRADIVLNSIYLCPMHSVRRPLRNWFWSRCHKSPFGSLSLGHGRVISLLRRHQRVGGNSPKSIGHTSHPLR